MKFDHLAISSSSLRAGQAVVEAALGVELAPGGAHPQFATHNRLLSLGPTEYLEVIAIDPSAPAPGRPRWFDLDRFAGPPRLANWVLRCDDIPVAQDALGTGDDPVLSLSRGDLRWQMAVPENGCLAYDGAAPALIRWQGAGHPAERLPDQGCRLLQLQITHPQADVLTRALGAVSDPRITVAPGPAKALRALIQTPKGPVWLT